MPGPWTQAGPPPQASNSSPQNVRPLVTTSTVVLPAGTMQLTGHTPPAQVVTTTTEVYTPGVIPHQYMTLGLNPVYLGMSQANEAGMLATFKILAMFSGPGGAVIIAIISVAEGDYVQRNQFPFARIAGLTVRAFVFTRASPNGVTFEARVLLHRHFVFELSYSRA